MTAVWIGLLAWVVVPPALFLGIPLLLCGSRGGRPEANAHPSIRNGGMDDYS